VVLRRVAPARRQVGDAAFTQNSCVLLRQAHPQLSAQGGIMPENPTPLQQRLCHSVTPWQSYTPSRGCATEAP
jgi:hypothetical protein